MRKKSRKVGKKSHPAAPVYGSDDERAYEKEAVPDPKSKEYYHDDIDDFYEQREKVLLERGVRQDEDAEMDTDEEEVLAIVSDDDTSDEEIQMYKKQLRKINQKQRKERMDSDVEDEGLKQDESWGKNRSKYYGADVEDGDIDLSGSEDDEGKAALEEKEALALQKKMAEQLDEEDFGLEIFKPKKSEDGATDQERIITDLSQMSKRDKLQLLKKESPEMLTLIEDFKTKMSEVQDTLQPLMKLVREKKLRGKAADYIHTKFRLALNYCTNISFYMMLKSQQTLVHNHPVIKRLLQFRNLMKQLEPVDEKLKTELVDIVTRLKNGEDIDFSQSSEPSKTFIRRKSRISEDRSLEKRKLSDLVSESEDENAEDEIKGGGGGRKSKKKKKTEANYETGDEKAALAYYEMLKGGRKKPEEEDEDSDGGLEQGEPDMEGDVGQEDADAKRGITYQISKNKGLTPHKKKELRNPRVKHRMKYRKAKIRRKGQIREARTELARYGGETSGIRAGIKRSVKLK